MKQQAIIYYNPTCPYCHKALDFFAEQLPDVKLTKVELNGQPGKNRIKFYDGLELCHLGEKAIPLIIIGKQCFQGFDDDIVAEILELFNK